MQRIADGLKPRCNPGTHVSSGMLVHQIAFPTDLPQVQQQSQLTQHYYSIIHAV